MRDSLKRTLGNHLELRYESIGTFRARFLQLSSYRGYLNGDLRLRRTLASKTREAKRPVLTHLKALEAR